MSDPALTPIGGKDAAHDFPLPWLGETAGDCPVCVPSGALGADESYRRVGLWVLRQGGGGCFLLPPFLVFGTLALVSL